MEDSPKGYKYLFSPFVKSPAQGEDVYKYLNARSLKDSGPTKVAVFAEKTDWGKELGAYGRITLPSMGYEIVDYEEYALGPKTIQT